MGYKALVCVCVVKMWKRKGTINNREREVTYCGGRVVVVVVFFFFFFFLILIFNKFFYLFIYSFIKIKIIIF